MLCSTDFSNSAPIKTTISTKYICRHNIIFIKDENYQPNQQIRKTRMNETVNTSSINCDLKVGTLNEGEAMSKETKELNILIRRVGLEDHLSIVKLFQVALHLCPEIMSLNNLNKFIFHNFNFYNIF